MTGFAGATPLSTHPIPNHAPSLTGHSPARPDTETLGSGADGAEFVQVPQPVPADLGACPQFDMGDADLVSLLAAIRTGDPARFDERQNFGAIAACEQLLRFVGARQIHHMATAARQVAPAPEREPESSHTPSEEPPDEPNHAAAQETDQAPGVDPSANANARPGP